MSNNDHRIQFYTGCLLGGAIGDALGAPVEFKKLHEIRERYGPDGICGMEKKYGRRGAITDDTQMTLFTAEGLLRSHARFKDKGICSVSDVVHYAYIRWLQTQGDVPEQCNGASFKDSFLLLIPELNSRRGPGNTCLSALRSGRIGSIREPINNSKGCGGIMRMAPAGLMGNVMNNVFQTGCECAAITHGHPSGYLAAGFFAELIKEIINGAGLREAIDHCATLLKTYKGHQECLDAVQQALSCSERSEPVPETVESLGGGWVAEESLAIALYCALVFENDFRKGVLLAVNHGGDSDSTGAITGNILGALLGRSSIPDEWITQVELADVINGVAMDLYNADHLGVIDCVKYPPN